MRAIHYRSPGRVALCGRGGDVPLTLGRPSCGMCRLLITRAAICLDPPQPSPLAWVRVGMILDAWRARYYGVAS